MKDAKYFKEHVIMIVEVEYDGGGRYRMAMRGCDVRGFCNRLGEGEWVSDVDYSTEQVDEWCRKVLNSAHYNWKYNSQWVKSLNLTSLWGLIDYIIDHKLVA